MKALIKALRVASRGALTGLDVRLDFPDACAGKHIVPARHGERSTWASLPPRKPKTPQENESSHLNLSGPRSNLYCRKSRNRHFGKNEKPDQRLKFQAGGTALLESPDHATLNAYSWEIVYKTHHKGRSPVSIVPQDMLPSTRW